MSLYLHYKDQQTGPFTEDQIRQMLQTGQISRDALAWKEGMANWTPVQQVVGSALNPAAPLAGVAGVTTAPQSGGRPVLGWISLVISIISIPSWIILLVVEGMAQNAGTANESGFSTIVGLFFLLGVFSNFVAMILGFVGIFTGKAKIVPILGACFNAFVLLGLLVLILIGLSVKNHQ